MRHYIYQLITSCNTVFYIGRTSDPKRRKQEHIYNTLFGSEDKYIAMRAFRQNGIEWDLEVIAEVSSEDEPYEDYYMYKALMAGAPLTNMKMGDAVMCLDNPNIQSYAELKAYATPVILTKPKAKTKRTATHNSPGESLFFSENLGNVATSGGLKAILAKRNK